MEVELDIGEGARLLSNHVDDDWTRFYLSFEDVLIPLGAESLQHVREWLEGRLWKAHGGEKAGFYLNFSDPHASLSVTPTVESLIVRVWDKDGVLLFKREIKEMSPCLGD